MSEAKHTPGPWVWMDDDVSEFSGSYRLAPGVLTTELPDGTPWGDEIDKANARLIAAAPDLLEPAKRYIAQIDAIGLPDDEVTSLFRAAIAKAEGRS